jgi:hypothetical protein
MKYPPQGITVGGAKQAFANAIANLSTDARDCIKMETLVNEGRLTVDQVASYVQNVETASFWAAIFNTWSDAFAASVLNSPNITAARAKGILADPNLTANKTQSILYNMPFGSKLVDISTYGASDLNVTADTTITGVNRYATLTVASGVTLTVDGQPAALIAKTINNNGTIAKTATGAAGGAAGGSGGGPGGKGGGGLIIFTDNLNNSGTVNADGAAGGNGSTTATSGDGGEGSDGAFIRVGTDVAGTGGNGGEGGGGAGIGRVNGAGGGATLNYYGGLGGSSTYTTYTDYPTLADDIKKATIDWVIVNVYAKTPTTTKSYPNMYGSGGGGGAVEDTVGCCGGGGGGGGEITALCITLNNTGTIRANGGNGGNGGTEGPRDSSGGGGGGGIVYALYKSLTASGTLTATGGTYGSDDRLGTAGTAGTAKAVAI